LIENAFNRSYYVYVFIIPQKKFFFKGFSRFLSKLLLFFPTFQRKSEKVFILTAKKSLSSIDNLF